MKVIKISEAAIQMALSDVRYGKMTLYVAIDGAGQPLSCCGDLSQVKLGAKRAGVVDIIEFPPVCIPQIQSLYKTA